MKPFDSRYPNGKPIPIGVIAHCPKCELGKDWYTYPGTLCLACQNENLTQEDMAYQNDQNPY